MIHIYFKLFNSIKATHEAKEFARLELNGLFGIVEPVMNFIDEILHGALGRFSTAQFLNGKDCIRVVDVLTHELPYGRIQGYKGSIEDIKDISKLIRRLAYTREIFVVAESSNGKDNLFKLFPKASIGKNAQFTEVNGIALFRFITNQFFLEKSEYLSKLSRNQKEIDDNIEVLFSYLTNKFYRIPASATMRVGKRLDDYFAIREEPSLYLSHYMHPYKGKFHPRMVRAIINYIIPEDDGIVMDNFCGSGTTLVEATLMGLDSVGVEINPLSVLMSNVKCHSLTELDPAKLPQFIEAFLDTYTATYKRTNAKMTTIEAAIERKSEQKPTSSTSKVMKAIKEELIQWNRKCYGLDDDILLKIILCKEQIESIKDKYLREFMLLALSGSISDITRRRSIEFHDVLRERLDDLCLRIYLFHALNKILKIRPGKAECIVGDNRSLPKHPRLKPSSIEANVNSPPYSTALNYIENDQPQLTILTLQEDLDQLSRNMIGFPGKNYERNELLNEIESGAKEFSRLPDEAKQVVTRLLEGGREDRAFRCYKFFKDTYNTMNEMWRVLKSGAKYAIIIGNNNFKLIGQEDEEQIATNEEENGLGADLEFDSTEYLNIPVNLPGLVTVRNDEVTIQIGHKIGFELDCKVTRVLEKSSGGAIRYESIVILKKP